MDESTFWLQYWPVLTGAFVIPLVQWLKGKIPGDWPIASMGMSIAANALLVLAVNLIFGLNLTWVGALPYIAGGYVVSTLGHAGSKTITKNVITNQPS